MNHITDTAKPDRAAVIDSAMRPEVRELHALNPLTYAGATAILSRVLNQRDQREWERAQAVNARVELQRKYENAVDERDELRAQTIWPDRPDVHKIK